MTPWRTEYKVLLLIVAVFVVSFYLPVEWLQDNDRVTSAFWEALYLTRWYAQEHVLLCLIPAFFIAGAIGVFVSQASVMRYLGAKANKVVAYSVASVSGTILAVCSCTVLPLFAGIYRMGAGLGPASAFLYAGPAINALAIILTARVLGFELGVARAVGAIVFSIVIGLCMHFLFRREEEEKAELALHLPSPEATRPLWKTATFFAIMVGILVFANFGEPKESTGWWHLIFSAKWWVSAALGLLLAFVLVRWLALPLWKVALIGGVTGLGALLSHGDPIIPFAAASIGLGWATSTEEGEAGEWFSASWGFTKQILPLLLAGVLVAGALLGRPGHEGLIPSEWVSAAVGGNSLGANLFASVAGAFMYFATLTEIPILEGLIDNGMGKGPALALLLAGPALSLPNMLVVRSVLGTKKTTAFVLLVMLMATLSGLIYGAIFDT